MSNYVLIVFMFFIKSLPGTAQAQDSVAHVSELFPEPVVELNWNSRSGNRLLSESRDPDILRNQSLLTDRGFIYDVSHCPLGNEQVILQTIESRRGRFPIIFICHDNENGAFDSASRYLAENGGTIVALHCQEQRECGGLDPNRSFRAGSNPYADCIMQQFAGQRFVVTMHNNTPTPGVSSLHPNERAGEIGYHRGGNDDNLYYISGLTPDPQGLQQKFLDFTEQRGTNVIYEHATGGGRYGSSMSHYVARETDMEMYINVEAEHSHSGVMAPENADAQDAMLQDALTFLSNMELH
jgi:hypothetical protein